MEAKVFNVPLILEERKLQLEKVKESLTREENVLLKQRKHYHQVLIIIFL